MRSSFMIGDISPLRLAWIDPTPDADVDDAEPATIERPAA